MTRKDVTELYFITAIDNVPSILEHGILCHKKSARLSHRSIANGDVQQLRTDKQIPGTGKHLHDYANMYFDAHNPMLSRRRAENDRICVLRILSQVLDLDGVIVSDRNAARGWARFSPVDEGLAMLVRDRVFAESWLHDNPVEYDEHKGIKCAEVLVPKRVEAKYVFAAYVASRTAKDAFQACCTLPVELKSGMFF